MLTADIEWKTIKPPQQLTDFVESFWMVANHADKEHKIVILPDGRFDIIFSSSANEPLEATLRGLDTEPDQTTIPPKTLIFAVSFKLLAIEYLLDAKVNSLLNHGLHLPADFWRITKNDFTDFDGFCKKVTKTLLTSIKPDIDSRKQTLFDLIYTSNGTLSVKELSDKVFWSSRQINRYFTQQFGLSLKAYCNIIRFKSSLYHIKKGRLFPELNFTDQTHFIKEVKKMAGVTPKELARNQNDRFILLSSLP
jgi:AraC-like DNA-binding protein